MSKIIAAAEAGKIKTLKVFLSKPEASSKLTKCDPEGFGAIHYASLNGHKDCVLELLKAGANPSMRSNAGVEPLMLAAQNAHIDVCEVLIKFCEDNTSNKNKDKSSKIPSVSKLVNSIDKDGQSALLYAAQEADAATVKFLINEGKANAEIKDNDGWGCVHYAAQGGQDILEFLVVAEEEDQETNKKKKKTNIELLFQKTNDGSTPLHVAAEAGEVEICEWMLNLVKESSVSSSPSLLEMKDDSGFTALHAVCSSEQEHLDLVIFLVSKAGADTFAQTKPLTAEEAREQHKKQLLHDYKQQQNHHNHHNRHGTSNNKDDQKESLADDGLDDDAEDTSTNDELKKKNLEKDKSEKDEALISKLISQEELDKIGPLPARTPLELAEEVGHSRIVAYLKTQMEKLEKKNKSAPESAEGRTRTVYLVVSDDSSMLDHQHEEEEDAAGSIKAKQENEEETEQSTIDEALLRSKFIKQSTDAFSITKVQCISILLKMFPEESVADFTEALKKISSNEDTKQEIVTFDVCLAVAKKVVLGK